MKFIAVIASLIAATHAQNQGQCKVVSDFIEISVKFFLLITHLYNSKLELYGRAEQVQRYMWLKRRLLG